MYIIATIGEVLLVGWIAVAIFVLLPVSLILAYFSTESAVRRLIARFTRHRRQ